MNALSILLFALILLPNICLAQYDISIDELMERYVESAEGIDDVDLNRIKEKFEYRLENPLNLNTCDIDEIKELEILSDLQIRAFFEYRTNLGNLYSIYELQAIPLFDLQVINLIRSLVTVGNAEYNYNKSLSQMLKQSKKSVFLKTKMVVEDKAGFLSKDSIPPKYEGNKYGYYTKFRLKYENRLDIGFIAEKDSGEAFFKGNNRYGFDYNSVHLFLYKYKSWLKELNIGDYSISLGQGLILHNDFSRGKSALVTKIKKNVSRVVRPYSSVNENMYFRGLATTFILSKKFEISAFSSFKYIDATLKEIDNNLINNQIFASSLQISGFHRLESEIKGKHSIRELAIGSRVNYKLKYGYLGLNVVSFNFDKPLVRQEKLYNKFKFSDSHLLNISFDYSYLFERILIFGEIARSRNNAYAILQGIQLVPSSHFDIALLYRNYSKGYESLNSNSFGETVGTNNEEGLYVGMNLYLNSKWTLSFYHDIWKFPWLRYNVSSPGFGNEYFLLLKYKKRRRYSFYTQFKYENKSRDIVEGYNLKKTYQGEKIRLRFHQSVKLNKQWELRNRIELSDFRHKDIHSKGILIYQDIVFRAVRFPISFTFRYAIFDIDDYNSAIYAYENDIMGESLIPAYFRNGYRVYMNLKYRPNSNLTSEIRWARWYFPEEETIGSGSELINSNYKTDMKMQVIFIF